MVLGKEIACRVDEYGAVRVFDDGCKRYLCFGDNDEQSCQLKADPGLLQHDYTRAMLLVLLFTQPRYAMVFGLGGGCLINCLHGWDTGLKLQAVELRACVVDLALQYFHLPRSKRLQVSIADAEVFLATGGHKKADIIFSDLYTEHGAAASQTTEAYIKGCAELLKPDGWLVINCWLEHREQIWSLACLHDFFQDVRVTTTVSGNWVILAGKRVDSQNQTQLRDKAQKLSKQLGFSLSPALKRLQPL